MGSMLNMKQSKHVSALVVGFLFFAIEVRVFGDELDKPVEIIEDSFGSDWKKWDSKDIFLSLPDHLIGVSLRVRAENLPNLKSNGTIGSIVIGGIKIIYHVRVRGPKHLRIHLTVTKDEKVEKWDMMRKLGKWHVTPIASE